MRHAHSPSDSVSASDVAEYLKEFSKGITRQVTSEIRDVTNAMNDHEHATILDVRRYSPPDLFEQQQQQLQQHQPSNSAASVAKE